MEYQVIVPPTADGAREVRIVAWLKAVGDAVKKGRGLVEVTTEKITLYIPAPAGGTLQEIRAPAGEKARVGEVIGVVVA